MSIKLSIDKKAIDKLNLALVEYAENVRTKLIERVADAVVARISDETKDKFPIEKTINKEEGIVRISAYGPVAVKSEEEIHAFEYTAADIKNVVKNIQW